MKKFATTSKFVVSSQVWKNTIPTRDCDVLMTFPAKTADETLMWVLQRLRQRMPELIVHVRHHSNTGFYGFYLTATYENLLKGAEELAICKPVKTEYGGGKKEFVYEDQDYFEGVENSLTFLNTMERQSIIQQMVNNLRAIDGDQLLKVKFVEGQAIIPILESKKVISAVFPLHNSDDLAELNKTWVQKPHRCQPLDTIARYFGVKISMYFGYLGHYTKALTIPAFVGLIFFFMSGKNQDRDDVIFVLFALINVVWSTLYLEHWKRRSAEFAYRWGTLDKEDELLTEPRPLFKGPLRKSPVTGRMEATHPAWKRNCFRYFVSMPIIFSCLGVVFISMWTIFRIQDAVNDQVKEGDLPSFFKFFPKILLAVSIGVLDDIYKKVAFWLNDMENYRLDDEYEAQLCLKIVSFQFFNSYLSLFYIAFYVQDQERLRDQLAALLITKQVIGNIKEALLPYVIAKLKLFRVGMKMQKEADRIAAQAPAPSSGVTKQPEELGSDGVRERYVGDKSELKQTDSHNPALDMAHSGTQLTQAEVEAGMKTYEDTFEDYLEMLIQFGYVTLFSSAFPLAAMCALLNNVVEIRSDAFKLCISLQRPFGQSVDGIGTWQDGLEIMSLIAVLVNCALIGMSGLADRMFPDMSAAQRVIFIVLLEHAILVIKMIVAYAIPDVPQWVAEEKARLEFTRREALKRLESKSSNGSRDAPNGRPSERNGRDGRPVEHDIPRRSPPVTPDNPMANLTLRAALRSPDQGVKKEI